MTDRNKNQFEKTNAEKTDAEKTGMLKLDDIPYDGKHDTNSDEDIEIRALSKIVPSIYGINPVEAITAIDAYLDLQIRRYRQNDIINEYNNINSQVEKKERDEARYKNQIALRKELKHFLKKGTGSPSQKRLKIESIIKDLDKQIEHYEKNRDKIQSFTKEQGERDQEDALTNKRLESLKKDKILDEEDTASLSKKHANGYRGYVNHFIENIDKTRKSIDNNEKNISDESKKAMKVKIAEMSNQRLEATKEFEEAIEKNGLKEGSIDYINEEIKLNNKRIKAQNKLISFAKENNWVSEILGNKVDVKRYLEKNEKLKQIQQKKLYTLRDQYNNSGYSTSKALDLVTKEQNIYRNERDEIKERLVIEEDGEARDILNKKLKEVQAKVWEFGEKAHNLRLKLKEEKEEQNASLQKNKDKGLSSGKNVKSDPVSTQDGITASKMEAITSSKSVTKMPTTGQATSSRGRVATSSVSGPNSAASGGTVGTSGKSASGNVIPTSNGAGQTPGIAAFVGKVPETQNPKTEVAANPSTGKEAVQAPGVATVDGKASDSINPKTGAAAQTGMGGDKCSCCVELKAIRSFLENSKLSRTDKEKAGKKLDEFETIVSTEEHSEVSAVGGNLAPEAIEMSAGKMMEFTVPVEKINSSPVYMVDGASGNPGRSVSVDNEINGGGNLPLYAMKEISCNTDKYKMKSSPDVYLWEWLGSGGMNKEAIKKQPSFHVPGIVGKEAIQKLPALPGPIGANAEITQNLPYIPGSEATGQNGFWKRPDFKGLDGLPRMPESVNNTGIRPDDISVKEQILRNYLYDRNKDNTGTSIAVDGALKPFPAATGGMTVSQDMVYRKDGDYRDYTRINGKPLKTFNPDVVKRHFPSSLKSAKNEIKESFRDKMNQPLNVAAAPVGTAGIDDVRAQMTRVKEAPSPGENMQAVLNRMGQTLKHIDTVLNNRLPGDNF